MSQLYIGLMAGTSLDGIDAALVDFADGMQLQAFHYTAFSDSLRKRIQAISRADQPILLNDYGTLDGELGHYFADAVQGLLQQAGVAAGQIAAIGSHGQTVYHAPQAEYGFTLQIGDPNRIAYRTGITTVADFRRRDIAAGGQGAPLAPAFHQAAFARDGVSRCIVNIGGIANVTVLGGECVIGFDTGPGNGLMDAWIQRQRGMTYDANGDWAAQGRVQNTLLDDFLDDTYFALPPPKSTGKEYFSDAWLEHKLLMHGDFDAADVQATLCRLTAISIADAIRQHAPQAQEILVCGGGAHNQYLLLELQHSLDLPVESTALLGVHPDHVEAMAFAWLAKQTLSRQPGNLHSVTGADRAVVLGGVYYP
jgi:anhydro-N-acetylmuramic acid kinase